MPRPAHWDPGTGNGSLMRTGPVCLPFLGNRDKIARVARQVSDLTHADPYAGDACTLWSLAIDRAISAGQDAKPIAGTAIGELVMAGLDYLPARNAYWAAQIKLAMGSPAGWFTQNGSACGAFRCALSAAVHARSLADGLQLAVATGGDTDTVAAIAGALLGAIHGASAVPPAWRRRVFGWSPDGRLDAAGLERLALAAAGCDRMTA
jgi:ADP-ribosylglycohydrolase